MPKSNKMKQAWCTAHAGLGPKTESNLQQSPGLRPASRLLCISVPAHCGPRSRWRLEDMAASRLPPATLTLKQFMRRQQVLLLYRRILQAIRQVPNDSDRKYLKDWAREEFKRNKNATEEDTIRMMITQGNMQLKELEKTLALAKS
ncbi:LYR motif-containing protein 2 [Sorex araneus]|uniref:LYR motif-containing protein 2 n=1 Tax=Sorex araneus TaxID=42254 RepID=UPI0024338F06|nr:LYR motif-containing protein 2 [Sorex araneus]